MTHIPYRSKLKVLSNKQFETTEIIIDQTLCKLRAYQYCHKWIFCVGGSQHLLRIDGDGITITTCHHSK